MLLPAQVVHALGGSVSLLEAALAEPAAVAWRAIGRGRPRPGERVAVVGDGTLALITVHLLRLYSSAELIVCGQRPAHGLAAELGATGFTVDTPDEQFDLVIEAAGTAGAVERALGLARRGGRVVLVGLAGNDVKAAFGIDEAVNNRSR